MPTNATTPLPELIHRLKREITGEIRFDYSTRLLYSTDASIYQIEPLGVVFPKTLDELCAVVEIGAEFEVPLLPRGAGSSLAGQAIGEALIVDCSRYLNQQLDINPEEKTATVEPGVILNTLNRAAAPYGLQFGPDPASAELATMGGSLANNASGAHSIIFGMAADHILSVEVVFSDGSMATFEEITLNEAQRRSRIKGEGLGDKTVGIGYIEKRGGIEEAVYRTALRIRENFTGIIREKWPRTWRRASGYNLSYLLPWSPSQPPGWEFGPYPPVSPNTLNLAHLIAGSEGTLAIIRRATVRLVPKPRYTTLGVLAYPGLVEACEAVPDLLEQGPSAIELIPKSLIQLARSVPSYARQVSSLDRLSSNGNDPAAFLVVEFAGDDPGKLRQQVLKLGEDALIAETPTDQKKIWGVRKAGLGILLSHPGEPKPVTFIEDLSVSVDRLSDFVRQLERLLEDHNIQGDFYAHASAGCLHIRPLLNVKTVQGVTKMRKIASEAVDLALQLGGAVTGEHGDGLARSEWMQRAFGPQVMVAFRELKEAADPKGILNPGKILGAPPMDANLRYGERYQALTWQSTLDFSRQAGLSGAIELCNGSGVCRKAEGVMCPSFQATADEMHSTRGRANLLRAMISGRFSTKQLAEEAVHEALDLCLACKGCKSECPSAVDMAKLKYEFLDHYFGPDAASPHRRPLQDYLFAYIGPLAGFGHYFAPLVNPLLHHPIFGALRKLLFGIARQRKLPTIQRKSLRELVRISLVKQQSNVELSSSNSTDPLPPSCLFLSDPFTEYFQPQVGLDALQVLTAAGYRSQIIPIIGSGRTLISKGFLVLAREHAKHVVEAIYRLDPHGVLPVVGVEPSEIYTLRDEFFDLLPQDGRLKSLAERAFMVDEFLVRPGADGKSRTLPIGENGSQQGIVLVHGHCYQKSQPPAADGHPNGVDATVKMLEAAGYQVSVIDAGCCGMAGAFGYEAEHYEISMKIGELALFPAIRAALRERDNVVLATPGVSCQSQIEDGTGRKPVHPITLAARTLARPTP